VETADDTEERRDSAILVCTLEQIERGYPEIDICTDIVHI
jgi:hypothetical protein